MRALQLTTWDTAGDRFNGSVIHRALRERGHESAMAVHVKRGGDPAVHRIGNRLTRAIDGRVLAPLEQRLSLQALLPIGASTLHLRSYFRRAELIHLHLIHALPFFSLLNLPLMRRRRLVWTMHDPWMATGHCVYPCDCHRWLSGCGECPDLERPFAMARDRTARMWRTKKAVMDRARVTLVVASRFMEELVAASPILGRFPRRLIPFGVSSEVFNPTGRDQARSALGIPPEARVLAFRYRGIDDPHKGGRTLVEALRRLRPVRPTWLLVIEGGDGLEPLEEDFRRIDMGWVDDAETLAGALRAADLFLMPSTAEAFGVMAVEAMACGTPVIVSEGTALPEIVRPPEAGLAVPPDRPDELALAIGRLLADEQARHEMSENALRIVQEDYTEERYVDRHIELYETLCDG
jgi:glycosyltransferase involved in cell wall biosynthesis